MTDRECFVGKIVTSPADNADRLVFADWLDENGNETDRAFAEFVRVQVRMATQEPRCTCSTDSDGRHSGCPYLQRLKDRPREQELWQTDLRQPRPHPISGINVPPVIPEWALAGHTTALLKTTTDINWLPYPARDVGRIILAIPRRGFVDEVRCSIATWTEIAGEICKSHPLTSVRPTDREPGRTAITETPFRGTTIRGNAYWSDAPEFDHGLPRELLDELSGGERHTDLNTAIRVYETADDAWADLSRVLVAIGRLRAGLPPL